MPIILTTVFGKGPAEVGMIIFPGAIIAVIAGQFIGRLIDRFGNAPLIIFGQLFLLSATILFAFVIYHKSLFYTFNLYVREHWLYSTFNEHF